MSRMPALTGSRLTILLTGVFAGGILVGYWYAESHADFAIRRAGNGLVGEFAQITTKHPQVTGPVWAVTRMLENGEVATQVEFVGDKPTGGMRAWTNGRLDIETTVDENGHGTSTSFQPTLLPRSRCDWDPQSGAETWQTFDTKGTLIHQFRDVHRVREGETTYYYESGQLAARVIYAGGRIEGGRECFDREGNPVDEEQLPAEVRAMIEDDVRRAAQRAKSGGAADDHPVSHNR